VHQVLRFDRLDQDSTDVEGVMLSIREGFFVCYDAAALLLGAQLDFILIAVLMRDKDNIRSRVISLPCEWVYIDYSPVISCQAIAAVALIE
jgi:hypothetical protein